MHLFIKFKVDILDDKLRKAVKVIMSLGPVRIRKSMLDVLYAQFEPLEWVAISPIIRCATYFISKKNLVNNSLRPWRE